MFIPDPDIDFFCPSLIPDPGVKKAAYPGSATLVGGSVADLDLHQFGESGSESAAD